MVHVEIQSAAPDPWSITEFITGEESFAHRRKSASEKWIQCNHLRKFRRGNAFENTTMDPNEQAQRVQSLVRAVVPCNLGQLAAKCLRLRQTLGRLSVTLRALLYIFLGRCHRRILPLSLTAVALCPEETRRHP